MAFRISINATYTARPRRRGDRVKPREPLPSANVKRSIYLGGRKTSVTLEDGFLERPQRDRGRPRDFDRPTNLENGRRPRGQQLVVGYTIVCSRSLLSAGSR